MWRDIFNYSSSVEYKQGVEGYYIPSTSEMITTKLSKVFQQKIMGLITSDVVEKEGWYKFKVKKLNELSTDNFNLLDDFESKAKWELGSVPIHNLDDIKSVVEVDSPIYSIIYPIIRKAEKLQLSLPTTRIYIDIQAKNYLEYRGNIVGADAIFISGEVSDEDAEIMRDVIFS